MELGDRLKTAREKRGYDSAADAARALGVKYGTYSGHENNSRGIKIDDLLRYAKFFRVSPAWLAFGPGYEDSDLLFEAGIAGDRDDEVPKHRHGEGVRVAGYVAAGQWHEPDELDQPFITNLYVPPDPRFAENQQRVWIVQGRSIERTASDGKALVGVLLSEGAAIEPSDGDLVIAERRRAQGGLIERTAKRLRIYPGRIELWPEYIDDTLNVPLRLSADDGHEDDGTEVAIIAVVIGVYESLR